MLFFLETLKIADFADCGYYHIKEFFFWTKFGIVNGAWYERNLDEIELYNSSMAQWTTTDHNSSLKNAWREIFECSNSKQWEFFCSFKMVTAYSVSVCLIRNDYCLEWFHQLEFLEGFLYGCVASIELTNKLVTKPFSLTHLITAVHWVSDWA